MKINKNLNQSSRSDKFLANPFVVLFAVIALFMITDILAAILLQLSGQNLSSPSTTTYFMYGVVKCVLLFIFLALTTKLTRLNWQSFGFRSPRLKTLALILPTFGAYFLLSVLGTALAKLIFSNFDISQPQDVGFKDVTLPIELLLTGISLVVITPIVEEVLFRGVLFKGLRVRLPFWLSAVVTSVLFAAAHGQWNVAVDTFALSLALCF